MREFKDAMPQGAVFKKQGAAHHSRAWCCGQVAPLCAVGDNGRQHRADVPGCLTMHSSTMHPAHALQHNAILHPAVPPTTHVQGGVVRLPSYVK